MLRAPIIWLAFLALFLVGCAKTSSEATVNSDGSWTRSLKLTVTKSFGEEEWSDVFAIPSSPDYKKFEEIKDSEKITTLTRSFKAGEGPITDIVIREKDATKVKNYVVVRKLDNGQIEYYEKIVYTNTNNPKMEKEMESYIRDLKAAMPEGKATDEDLKVMAKKTLVSLTRLLLGPDDHLLGNLVLNPDGAARRLRVKIGQVEKKLLIEQFGDRLTEAERDEVVKKLLAKLDSKSITDSKKPDQESAPGDNQTSLIGMSVAVKLPGKIVSTNGEIDPFTGEVFWDFTTSSAEVDVLELRAICQP